MFHKKSYRLLLFLLIITCSGCSFRSVSWFSDKKESVPNESPEVSAESSVSESIPEQEETETSGPIRQKASTYEEVLEKTGIDLFVPEGASDAVWSLGEDGQAKVYGQVDFTAGESVCHLQAHKDQSLRNEDLQQQLSEYALTANMTGSGSLHDVPYYFWGNGNTRSCIWLKEGTFYQLTCEAEKEELLLELVSHLLLNERGEGAEWDPQAAQNKELIRFVSGKLWKYDEYEIYMFLSGNGTYVLYDEDHQALHEDVRFWQVSEETESSLELLNEYGEVFRILSFSEESSVLTDNDGDSMSVCDQVMDGTYTGCYLSSNEVSTAQIVIRQQMPLWYSDEIVYSLEIGDTLPVLPTEIEDRKVEMLEWLTDTDLQISMEDLLHWDDTALAWKLETTSHAFEVMGRAPMAEGMLFSDLLHEQTDVHETLQKCLQDSSAIMNAKIVVEDGEITAVYSGE